MKKKRAVINIPVRVKKPRCKEYDAAQRVLDYFNDAFDAENDDIYDNDIVLGFGPVKATVPLFPETWEILETALVQVQGFFKEEYGDDYDFSPLKK